MNFVINIPQGFKRQSRMAPTGHAFMFDRFTNIFVFCSVRMRYQKHTTKISLTLMNTIISFEETIETEVLKVY